MGHYVSVNGWLESPFSGPSARQQLEAAFESSWGVPLWTRDEFLAGGDSSGSQQYCYDDGWAIVGCREYVLATSCWVRTRAVLDFLDRVRALSAALNQAFLQNEDFQLPESRYAFSYGGSFIVRGLMGVEDHQCWVIREGIVHIYDKDTPLVKNWINAIHPPRSASSP